MTHPNPNLIGGHISPYRVLIVDDEIEHRFLEREILDLPTYTVTEASNGRDALALIQNEKFDVILCNHSAQKTLDTFFASFLKIPSAHGDVHFCRA
jgi:DNA-binding NtrC family response regulator